MIELRCYDFKLSASDRDSGANGDIRYDLTTSTDAFELDAVTGILSTRLALDREVFRRFISYCLLVLLMHFTYFRIRALLKVG